MCDVSDCEGLGVKSLEWVIFRLQEFAPWKEGSPEGGRIKRLGELAIVYRLLRRVDADPRNRISALASALPEIHAFILDQCEAIEYKELVRKRLKEGFFLLIPYLILRSFGCRIGYHEDSLRRMVRLGFPGSVERVPHRAMETQYCMWISGLREEEPPWPSLYGATFLKQVRSLIHLDRDDAYAITHTLMYLTDFGGLAASLDVTEIERVEQVLKCLLIHHARVADWDLTGELLLGLGFLARTSSAIYQAAEAGFLRFAWQSDGSLLPHTPDRCGEGAAASNVTRDDSGEKSEREIFDHRYHTTLVGLMHCAAAHLHSRSQVKCD